MSDIVIDLLEVSFLNDVRGPGPKAQSDFTKEWAVGRKFPSGHRYRILLVPAIASVIIERDWQEGEWAHLNADAQAVWNERGTAIIPYQGNVRGAIRKPDSVHERPTGIDVPDFSEGDTAMSDAPVEEPKKRRGARSLTPV